MVLNEKILDVQWILARLVERNKHMIPLNGKWFHRRDNVPGDMDLFAYGSIWITVPYDDIKNLTDAHEYSFGDIEREADRRYRVIHHIEKAMGWTPEIA